MGAALQMCLTSAEGKDHLPRPARNALPKAGEDAFGFLCCEGPGLQSSRRGSAKKNNTKSEIKKLQCLPKRWVLRSTCRLPEKEAK